MPGSCRAPVRKSPILLVILFFAIAVFGARSSIADNPESFPNYAQIDSADLAGEPILSSLPRGAEGIHIWFDSQGAWKIALPIGTANDTRTQYHGSAIFTLETPPTPGENVFIHNLGDMESLMGNDCYMLNDRWGWYQRGEKLYEIWWDFSTRDLQDGIPGLNDFIIISIYGGSASFNIWSSDGATGFGPGEILLGASMIRLSDIAGFDDDNLRFSDPYQNQAGRDPARDPNTTVFSRMDGNGASYNSDGQIIPGQEYPCGLINGENYGNRFSGSFEYEGDGIKFTSIITCDPEVRLEVNSVIVPPLADDTSDITVTACGGTQIWNLMKEYTPWVDVNRFGYYTDIGTGNVQTLVFAGLDSEGFIDSSFLAANTQIGFWLLNDINGDSIFNGDDSYLFSERALTQGSGANEHQWFMVYDVSAYKGTGATYDFYSTTEDYSFTGDFDYLLFIDDNHSSANFDHNDMILGILCPPNDPPVAMCPADTTVFLCELGEICLPGFSCFDSDGDLESCSVSLGSLNGETVCFTPTTAGVYDIALIATDSHGEADTCNTQVTVVLNSSPEVAVPNDTSIFVCDLSEICIPGFTYSDTDGNISSIDVTGGILNGDQVCFDPVEGANTITMIVTDDCGDADTAITVVTVDLNEPPVASGPSDTTMFVCDLGQICIDGFSYSDADGNISSVDVTGGVLASDQVCFDPVEGANTITMIVTDDCGEADTAITIVTVNLNEAPIAGSPNDTTMFVCDLSQICLSGFTYSDADGNVSSVDVTGGTLNGDQVCLDPVEGTNTVTMIVTDDCGDADTAITVVTIDLNEFPVAGSPNDTTMFVCDLSQICISGFTYSDADDNISSVDVTGGTLNGDQVCFDPVEGANTITMIIADDCGAADTTVTIVTVDLNEAPVAGSPNDTTMFVCDLNQICINGFTYIDVDGNISSVDVTGGILNGNQVCFDPVIGTNTLTMIVADSCGESDTAVTVVNIALNSSPYATGPNDTTIFMCALEDICISGFDYGDPDNNITSAYAVGGVLTGDTICFTPVVGSNTISLIVVDQCGDTDTASTVVTVDLNSAPLVSCPGDTSVLFVCEVSEICVGPFETSDVDGNLDSAYVVTDGFSGSFDGTTFCFTPNLRAIYQIIYVAVDLCGESDTCAVNVDVQMTNEPPMVQCPGDTSMVVCDLGEVCIPGFGYSDANNNIATVEVSNGIYDNGTVCFTPVEGSNPIVVTVTDSCGIYASCTTSVNIIINSPPVITCMDDTTLVVDDLSEICLSGMEVTDPDDNIVSVDVNIGAIVGEDICFIPVMGINEITVIATDECGEADTCEVSVTVGYCSYLPGDANADFDINGLDITLMVNFFKGGPALPDTCDCRPDVGEYPFFGAGDANGDCAFNGVDVTYLYNYLTYVIDVILYCPSCPPTQGWVTSVRDNKPPETTKIGEVKATKPPKIGER